jgi:hypothetical protein
MKHRLITKNVKFKHIPLISEFIYHDIRKLRLQIAYEEGGEEEAKRLGGHTKTTTLKMYYLSIVIAQKKNNGLKADI